MLVPFWKLRFFKNGELLEERDVRVSSASQENAFETLCVKGKCTNRTSLEEVVENADLICLDHSYGHRFEHWEMGHEKVDLKYANDIFEYIFHPIRIQKILP